MCATVSGELRTICRLYYCKLFRAKCLQVNDAAVTGVPVRLHVQTQATALRSSQPGLGSILTYMKFTFYMLALLAKKLTDHQATIKLSL